MARTHDKEAADRFERIAARAVLLLKMAGELLIELTGDEFPSMGQITSCPRDIESIKRASDLMGELNIVGNVRAVDLEHEHMRLITDQYMRLKLYVDGEAMWSERTSFGSSKDEIRTRDLTIHQVSAVRTQLFNVCGQQLKSRRFTDGLHVHFSVLRKQNTLDFERIKQGWVGEPAYFYRYYANVFGWDTPQTEGHTKGRLWDHAETHDFAQGEAGAPICGAHALTFVAQDRNSPRFFRGSRNHFSLDECHNIDGIRYAVSRTKSSVKKAIIDFLRRR